MDADLAEHAHAEGLEAREAAAIRLQRFFKSRKSRRAFEALTSKETIARLKALFLDDRAKKAGAEASPLYTVAALSQRDALRNDARVVSALAAAWTAVTEATDSDTALNYTAYMQMSRKVYLACYASEGMSDISPFDFQESAREEWQSDCGGSGELSAAAFEHSLSLIHI